MKFEYKNKKEEMKIATTNTLSVDLKNGHVLIIEELKTGKLAVTLREKSGKKIIGEDVDGFVMRFKKGDK